MDVKPSPDPRALSAQVEVALQAGQFVLHYQPKIELGGGRIVGAEALLRWQHPEHGMLHPAQILPALAESGRAFEVGDWVLRTACTHARAWQTEGHPPVTVAVNLSAVQFRDSALVPRVGAALAAAVADPRLLEIELTEDTVMRDAEHCAAKLAALKAMGVSFSLDDFGTGYSSLTYLRKFPLDQLKIDMSFVHGVTDNPDDAAIVRAVISLGHSLGLTLVAEGVETEAQVLWLRRERCDQIQGFVYSPAVPAPEFAELLRAGKRLFIGAGAAPADGKTLLVVDDEANIVNALVRLLRRDGYRILTAANAAEGFDVLARNAVQVVISDHKMPSMTGAEFLGRVKSLYPDTVRILLSGQIEVSALTEAWNRGAAYRFIVKPWEEEMLRESVREAFEHYAQAQDGGSDPAAAAVA